MTNPISGAPQPASQNVSTKETKTPKEKTPKSFYVIAGLTIFLMIAGSIASTVLSFAGLPFLINLAIIGSIVLATLLMLLISRLYLRYFHPEKKEEPQIPIEIEPEIELHPPRSLTEHLKNFFFETQNLPQGVEISDASEIKTFTLKKAQQVRIITAQAPNNCTILQDGEGVPRCFILPPKLKEDTKASKNFSLVMLRDQLTEEGSSPLLQDMEKTQRPGYWQRFPWGAGSSQGAPKECLLIWGPCGYYPQDIETLEKSGRQKDGSYIPATAAFIGSPHCHTKEFFKTFFLSLMREGITAIHLHAPAIFEPEDREGKNFYANARGGGGRSLGLMPHFFDAVKESIQDLNKEALENTESATLEITDQESNDASTKEETSPQYPLPKDGFTIYITEEGAPPLNSRRRR